MDQQMPMFDDPIPPPAEPKKPRRKPVRRKKPTPVRTIAYGAPKKRRKPNKVKVANPTSRLAVMFDCIYKIQAVLEPLPRDEKRAVLKSLLIGLKIP